MTAFKGPAAAVQPLAVFRVSERLLGWISAHQVAGSRSDEGARLSSHFGRRPLRTKSNGRLPCRRSARGQPSACAIRDLSVACPRCETAGMLANVDRREIKRSRRRFLIPAGRSPYAVGQLRNPANASFGGQGRWPVQSCRRSRPAARFFWVSHFSDLHRSHPRKCPGEFHHLIDLLRPG